MAQNAQKCFKRALCIATPISVWTKSRSWREPCSQVKRKSYSRAVDVVRWLRANTYRKNDVYKRSDVQVEKTTVYNLASFSSPTHSHTYTHTMHCCADARDVLYLEWQRCGVRLYAKRKQCPRIYFPRLTHVKTIVPSNWKCSSQWHCDSSDLRFLTATSHTA